MNSRRPPTSQLETFKGVFDEGETGCISVFLDAEPLIGRSGPDKNLAEEWQQAADQLLINIKKKLLDNVSTNNLLHNECGWWGEQVKSCTKNVYTHEHDLRGGTTSHGTNETRICQGTESMQ